MKVTCCLGAIIGVFLQQLECHALSKECHLDVGARHKKNHDMHHRRMVSINIDQSCTESDTVEVNIPHQQTKRSFKKITSNQVPSHKFFLGDNDIEQGNTLPSYTSWEGEDVSDGSTFTFVQDQNNNMAGSLVDLTNHEVYQFYNQYDGTMAVTITKSEDFATELDPLDVTPDEETWEMWGKNNNNNHQRHLVETVQSRNNDTTGLRFRLQETLRRQHDEIIKNKESRKLSDDGSVMDVMVVWTAKAECRNSGLSEGCTLTSQTESSMMSLVNLAITETNSAYTASGVDSELLLVNAYRHPDYVESSFGTALSELRSGGVSDVNTNRATYGADIVALLIDDSQYCGIGYVGPRIDLMYSVTAWNCATGYYSFGHEIGHNLGLLHDRGTSNACSSSNYNYGYRDPNANFRTVMAYSCRTDQCDNISGNGCTRINRYSNPVYLYNGLALGTSTADCARAINDVRVEVAGYYTHVPTGTPAPIGSPTPSPTRSSSTCTDVSGRFQVNGRFRSCAWAAKKNTEKRCRDSTISSNCPVTCGTCNSPTTSPTAPAPTPAPTSSSSCSDSTGSFTVGMFTRKCAWARKSNTEKKCNKQVVAENCPVTCDYCGCNDTRGRFTVGTRLRTCNWVSMMNTVKRCSLSGVSTKCPKTCGGCP